MTRAFERFLRSLSDDDLTRFAKERRTVRPPYWRAMRLALQIEIGRRGLSTDPAHAEPVVSADPEPPARVVIA